MGSGRYDVHSRSVRAAASGFTTKSASEIFAHRASEEMSPKGLNYREARDSAEHPKSLPIIIALDVTGSMGRIPHSLVKEGLPKIMSAILQNGIADPQVLFLGIGDHTCDNYPLQVGQFESSDELLDKWLTQLYLEGGGGANAGESYLLAWLLGANYTRTDHTEKRGCKGLLFTIGDEPCLADLSAAAQLEIFGNGVYTDFTENQLLALAREKYEVYHFHTRETRSGARPEVEGEWKRRLGDNCIPVDHHKDIPAKLAEIVGEVYDTQKSTVSTTIKGEDVSI